MTNEIQLRVKFFLHLICQCPDGVDNDVVDTADPNSDAIALFNLGAIKYSHPSVNLDDEDLMREP
jgi:hypothetical protein